MNNYDHENVQQQLPWVDISHTSRANTTVSGYCYKLVTVVQSACNFSYSIHEPPDNEYGISKPDGSWSGMIGQLTDGDPKVDMAIGDISVTPARCEQVDFTSAIFTEGISILIPAPTPGIKLLNCFRPFHSRVYINCIIKNQIFPI